MRSRIRRKRHPTPRFLGDAGLAAAIEAADLRTHVDETRLDAVTAERNEAG